MTAAAEIGIVGAGPAGIEAALQAGEAGATVVMLDRYRRPGGHYYKQAPANLKRDELLTTRETESAPLFRRLQRLDNVRAYYETTVWGAFAAEEKRGWVLSLHGPDAPPRLHVDILILATGAYDLVIPFPGWTLPGVFTAGAAQTLVEHQGVLPGRQVVVAGTGPLLLTVAATLLQAGATVTAILEGSRPQPRQLWRLVRAMRGQRRRLAEGWTALRTVMRAGVPYRWGYGVVSAAGEEEVEAATVAQLDRNWQPLPGSEESMAVDTVVVGCGFRAASHLARMLGCQHELKPAEGGYVPRRDHYLETTRPGVYAVGDGAGIGGATLARLEGRIAGLAAVRKLNRARRGTAGDAELMQAQQALWREQRFAHALNDLFSPNPGVYEFVTEETVVCRCEEVTRHALSMAAGQGVATLNELKGLTRIGMGNCQGRLCEEASAHLLARACGAAGADAVGCFTVRPPLYPMTVAELAAST